MTNCCDNGCGTQEVDFAASSGGEPDGVLPDGDTGDFLQWNGTLWVPSSWTLPLAVTGNDLGEVLTVDAVASTIFQPLFQRTLLQAFGARQVSATIIWLHTWSFDSAAQTTIAGAGFLLPPLSGRLRNMRVRHTTPVASADDILFTLVVNGVDTPLTVTLNTGAEYGENLVNVVAAGATDQLSVKAEGATAIRVTRVAVQFDLEY